MDKNIAVKRTTRIGIILEKIVGLKSVRTQKEDKELFELKKEMEETQNQIRILNNNFKWAEETDVEYFAFLLKAYEIKYTNLIKKAKRKRNVTAIS